MVKGNKKKATDIKKSTNTKKITTKKSKTVYTGSKTKTIRHLGIPKLGIPKLGRSALTTMIQWLIDLGGTEDIGKALTHDIIQIISDGTVPPTPRINMIVFLTKGEGIGHWVFYDNDGKEYNSYSLKHQKTGSHQFCQSFALIYACSYYNMSTFGKFFHDLIENDFGHNIRVVVEFWRYLFTGYDIAFSNYLIEQVKEINNELNTGSRRDNASIVEDSNEINLLFIQNLLDNIKLYSDQIAERC